MKSIIRTRVWSLFVIVVSLLLLTGIAVAQETISVTVGENQVGNLADANTPLLYSIFTAAPQSIVVQVLAISSGVAPSFRVFDPGGVVVVDTANPGTETIAQSSVNLASPGVYTIEVTSASGTAGQFLLSIQAGAPLAPPQPLALGQPVASSVDAQTTRRAYAFDGSLTDIQLLTVSSDQPEASFVTVLRDADTGETLSLNSAGLLGLRYRLPATERSYLLEMMHGGSGAPEAFTICLATESNPASCPQSSSEIVPVTGSPTATFTPTAFAPTLTTTLIPTFAPPTINPAGACQVASSGGQSINVRSGPGTGFSILTQLLPGAFAPVIGRLPDNSWFQVNVNGNIGWVSATVVTLGGNCAGVSIVVPPTVPPPAVTEEAATGTPTATFTPTSTPTPSATNIPGTLIFPLTRIFSITLIAPPFEIQPISPELDYTASPNYGQANLSAGFSPDPYSVGMTVGGNVDVSYLGSSCSGFATTAPSLRVNFSGGGASLLRFYFVGSGDTTLIVNDPYGNFYCVDESFGTTNPTIDFNNPAGGSYDLWVGSYASGATVSGTFYITENSGNHP